MFSCVFSPAYRGEGWDEGPFPRVAQFAERPLILTFSPDYRGEGTRQISPVRPAASILPEVPSRAGLVGDDGCRPSIGALGGTPAISGDGTDGVGAGLEAWE